MFDKKKFYEVVVLKSGQEYIGLVDREPFENFFSNANILIGLKVGDLFKTIDKKDIREITVLTTQLKIDGEDCFRFGFPNSNLKMSI